ncbi:DNA-binding response regulator [Planotetraspora silvatica]|uniref:DNA-binding response regulator n=1 Tax=Planotetraspora silvatica TaxID=234614 RepID=A0A8J3XMX0_9ACTN|nr:response regulator transcription factor [Planotetraspora silvatica]GII46655.1 DNA-binding response regulator [Planotetraspora silvatica]
MTADKPIRVAIADDHPMFRSGLRTLVEESPHLEFAGEAGDGEEALAICADTRPDVILMDIRMPGTSGVEATRRILAGQPAIGVLMLTMLEDDTSVFAAMRAGARGYILKGAAPDEIVRAVVAVAAGEAIFGAALATRMAHFFATGPRGGAHPFAALSSRERDVLDLIAAGHSNAVIAARLALSEKTIRNNVSSIFAKLQVVDRPTAIVRAREAGLGTPNSARGDTPV